MKPKRPCSYPACPELTHGRYCEPHQKEMDARYNKHERDPETGKRYGRGWRKVRAVYVAEHPLCEDCLAVGKLVPVDEVHHIIPLTAGGTHDPGNLRSLCTSCHSKITAREGGRWKRRADRV